MIEGLPGSGRGRPHETPAAHVGPGGVPGLVAVVDHGGETRVEVLGVQDLATRTPMRRDSLFRIASLTKPLTAAAAMLLVEAGRLQLDEPVDDLLPELADRRVLRRPDGPLDDTVPAHRPITLRDLLSFRFGLGAVIAPGVPPIQQAMTRAGLAPGPNPPLHAPDEWMRRLGALPLIRQPGERWLYHTGSDVLGVLIARASGRTLEDFLRQRLFAPLGMTDTGFHVPPEKLDRFVTSYMADPETGELLVYDEPRASRWGRPPAFASGGAGLVSTADDVLAFFRMLLNRGRHQGAPVLSEASVAQMTADQLTPEQKTRAGAEVILQGRGWGFGLASVARPDLDAGFPAGFGWEGGLGASAYADPARRLVGVLLTQRAMTSPRPPLVFRDFWRAAYA